MTTAPAKANGNTAPSTALTPYKQKIETVRSLLERSKAQIKLALPRHLSPDRMLRIVMTSVQRNPELLDCTPQSLIGAVIQSAQLGLEPDNVRGEAYIIPYRNKGVLEAQFQPGYKGLIKLARQSGEIGKVYARVVHANDEFDHEFGLHEKLVHRPSGEPDAGPITHVYAVAHFKDSAEPQFEVMTKAQVDAIRARSRSGNSGPWVSDYEAMAMKTVTKRLCKWLPGSVEKDQAVALDDQHEAGLPQGLGDVIEIPAESVIEQAPAPGKSLDELAKAAEQEMASK